MSFTTFQDEKTPFQAIKTRISKNQKIDRRGLAHGFGPKKAIFSTFLFLSNIGQENVFHNTLERKNAFLAYKNKKFNSRKIDIFPKGLTNGLGPKMAIFRTFFFQAIQAWKMSFTIFQNEETPFKAIKTRSSKNQKKIDIFPKGLTRGLTPKMAIFPIFFTQYRPGKCLLRKSRTKKCLSSL